MLGLLGRLWRRREDRRRLIFGYRDGRRVVYADPLNVVRQLEKRLGEDWGGQVWQLNQLRQPREDLPESLQMIRRRERDRLMESVISASRDVFRLADFSSDGTGATDADALDVLASFLVFLAELGERARPFSQSGSPTAASPDPSTTPPFADSIGSAASPVA